MGYTHYWYTKPAQLPSDKWKLFRDDAEKILAKAKALDFKLAGPRGTGKPVVNADTVSFNGSEHCGHKGQDISIPWPADDASGVARDGEDAISGSWFAGTKLSSRQCNGDCSYESCVIDRDTSESWFRKENHRGLSCAFDFCKTAYRPYDVVVTAILIAFKNRFGSDVTVSSDGEEKDWKEGQQLCLLSLGFLLPIPDLEEGNE